MQNLLRLIQVLVLVLLVGTALPSQAGLRCAQVLQQKTVVDFAPLLSKHFFTQKTEISELKTGKIIRFPSGREFEFVKPLGNGFFTIVLLVRDENGEYALRVPKIIMDNIQLTLHAAESFVNGESLLQENGVRVPKILEHSPGEFTLVEFMPVLFTLKDFLAGTIPSEFRSRSEELRLALIDFFASTYRFSRIGDLHTGQIAFDGSQWVLLDWTLEQTKLARRTLFRNRLVPEGPSILQGYFASQLLEEAPWLADTLQDASAAIRLRREQDQSPRPEPQSRVFFRF